MKKLFAGLAVVLATLFTAPDAQAMTLQQQRNQVFLELRTVLDETRAELNQRRAELLAATDPAERARLRSQVLALSGRVRFLVSTRTLARYHYSQEQLNLLILRFDLNVSPS